MPPTACLCRKKLKQCGWRPFAWSDSMLLMGRTTKRLRQMKRTRILVVDDSVTIRAMIETVLERDGRLGHVTRCNR